MNLLLRRIEYRSDGIFGNLRKESGEQIAVTLEHAYPNQGMDAFDAKIPEGKYTCVRGHHKINDTPNGFETFEITGVPGHSNILFHWGNFLRDSDGCVLLGSDIAQNGTGGAQMIIHSRDTFQRFMKLQEGVNEFQLIVIA